MLVEIGLVELGIYWVAVVDGSSTAENTEGVEEALWLWLGMKDLSNWQAAEVDSLLLGGLGVGKGRPAAIGSVEVEGKLDLDDVGLASSRPGILLTFLPFVTLPGFDLCPDSEGVRF